MKVGAVQMGILGLNCFAIRTAIGDNSRIRQRDNTLNIMENSEIKNALTVDVEDYFQVSAFSKTISPDAWSTLPLRVEKNTHRLLDLFDEKQVKGTFFVLGWVAERCPHLVREIVRREHEIASHGFSHQLIYEQTPKLFREETRRSKHLLEEITGKAVYGYRAASYSITRESTWALDILAELDFKYDSSIFPIHHDRYGIPDAKREPHRLDTPSGSSLIEFPISTWRWLGMNIPVSGGGYFRLFPYALSAYGLAKVNREGRTPFVFYLHPWEVDPRQPRIKSDLISRFRHYTNLHRTYPRLARLLDEFNFGTMQSVLGELGLL